MHKFVFKYIGDEPQVQWEAKGKGNHALGALQNLFDNIEVIVGENRYDNIDLWEKAIEAMGEPGKIITRRCFSTPEDNFDLTYSNFP